jgi:hypothetical protein
LLAAVTDCAAGGVDPCRNRGIRNDAPAPNRCKEIVSADDAVAIPDQKFQNVEDLRLDGSQGRSRTQLAPLGIENHVGKMERQDCGPW